LRAPDKRRVTMAANPGPGASRCAVIALGLLLPMSARADHHEAQWSARPFAGIAALAEEGVSTQNAMVGGVTLGFSYGVSNHLDLGGELVTLATTAPRFMDTAIIDGGAPYVGPLARRAGSALMLLGPTWRLGVTWVPVFTLAAGGGARYRSNGRFTEIDIVLDEQRAVVVLDLAATARVGIERRVLRRLVVGAYASALASWGPSAPLLPMASVSLGISYVNYPLWW
jgi:hypothetical protein